MPENKIVKYVPEGEKMGIKFIIDWSLRIALGAGVVLMFLMGMESDIRDNKTTLTAMHGQLKKIDSQVGEVLVKLQVKTAIHGERIKAVSARVDQLEKAKPAYRAPKRRGRR